MDHGTCRECGKTTALSKRGRPLMYCSKACSNRRFVAAWRRSHRDRQAEYYDRECQVCGTTFRSSRPTGKFCSDACKGAHYSATMATRCKLPADHPVLVLIADMKQAERDRRKADRREAERSKFEWRTARECPGCACWFTPIYTPNAVTCSARCSRRVHRWRRAARERDARGEFTWSEFMRIARKFEYCCAYCGIKPDRLDPDHVVPLSRGGSNTPSNLLPACLMCNSSKNAMLLHEWAAWLADRGKEPRRTAWEPGDSRYSHLAGALLAVA